MDLRNEIEHIFNNGYAWYQHNLGEAVIWHEFDSTASVYDNVYDEGGRAYTAGTIVPALWVIVTEDRATQSNEGRKPTERISLAVSARALDLSGISDPEDYTRHLNDVLRYEGRLWKVTDYNIRGRVPTEVIVGISGTQIYDDEEMTFDDLPPGMESIDRRLPYPNMEITDFPFHDSPGVYSLYPDLDQEIIFDGNAPGGA